MECSLKVKPSAPQELDVKFQGAGPGEANCLAQLSQVHPLKNSEENYQKNQQNIHMRMLRNREGLHAPLKLTMELHAARKVGRLPFLQSSNAMLDCLLGRDEMLEFADFLGSEDCEHLRQPHAVVERSFGIL